MLNKVQFQGRLTASPELKHTQSGVAVLEFTVAWSEKYKEIETKCFLRCKAWRQTAEFVSKYFDKGSEIIVEGKMITEQWEKDGQSQSRTICDVEKVHFCGRKSENGNIKTNTSDNNDAQLSDFEEILSDGEVPF